MIQIYNLDDCPLSYKNGFYGGMSGDKDGVLINGEEWIVKYPKNLSEMQGENASYSTAPLSEYIGSHIYDILGYLVHETILGERNNKLVVGCKDFATDGKVLLEVRTLKNHKGEELSKLLENSPVSSSETHITDLDELFLHLDKNPILNNVPDIKEYFFHQAIIDIFINNNDRNNGNWGILRQPGKEDTIAPVFDNGGCLNTKLSEDKLKRILCSPELENNATNVLTAYGKEGKQFNAKKFLSEVKDIPEFKKALEKTVPLIKTKLPEIRNMMDEIPRTHILKNGKEILVFSDERKELYKKQLSIRLEKLLVPEYEKIAARKYYTFSDAMEDHSKMDFNTTMQNFAKER